MAGTRARFVQLSDVNPVGHGSGAGLQGRATVGPIRWATRWRLGSQNQPGTLGLILADSFHAAWSKAPRIPFFNWFGLASASPTPKLSSNHPLSRFSSGEWPS